MSKHKKTKAPLETKAEDRFWTGAVREKTPLTLHLLTKDNVSGLPLFATEETVGVEVSGSETRLVSREELAYLEIHER
jgi:hypothetical protein